MRLARNHGELARGAVGLNLRLTEVQAAVWYVQLMKAEQIIARRREIAERLSKSAIGMPVYLPALRDGCTHSYYVWAVRCSRGNPKQLAKMLLAEGLPVKSGCYTPLYKLPAFQQAIHRKNVESTETHIIIYENCSYDPTDEQLKQISIAFEKVADASKT